MKTVTVVGATSPLGLSLTPALALDGWSVIATYRDRSTVPDEWRADGNIELRELDLSSSAHPVEHTDTIVWLAHLDAGRFNNPEIELNRAAVERYLNGLDLDRTRRFIFISSGGSVYGPAQKLPITEDHPLQPLSSYGRAKLAMEAEVRAFGERTGLETVMIRPGNIYGFERPDRTCKGVTAAFLNAVDHGLPFTLIHGGSTLRDFIHVDDVSRAIAVAAAAEQGGVVWNVGTGLGTSTVDWIELLRKNLDVQMPALIHKENYSSDVQENILSYGRIRDSTGWQPGIDINEGCRRTIEHWRSFHKASPRTEA